MSPISSQAPRPAAVIYSAVVGHIVLHRRKFRGLNQAAVAGAIGVSQSAYSRMEAGAIPITLEALEKVSAVLGCTPNEILQEADGHVQTLKSQGVMVVGGAELRKQPELGAALVLGLALLAALIAAAR